MKKFFSFFDDPISRTNEFFFNLEQEQIRKSIRSKYKNTLLEQAFWIPKTKNENKGLSKDTEERTVQRLMMSQVSYLMAQRLFTKRFAFVIPILTIILLFLLYSLYQSHTVSSHYHIMAVMGFIGVILILGTRFLTPVFAWLLLPNVAVREREIIEIENVMKRAVIRDIDKNTPPDLSDKKRILNVDAEGGAVAGQILSSDIETCALKKEWNTTKIIMLCFGLAYLSPILINISLIFAAIVYYFLMSKFKANKNPIISLLFLIIIPFGVAALTYYHGRSVALETGISFVLMLIPLFISLTRESPLMYRSKLLYKSVKESGSDILIDKVGKQYFINQEEAKQEQIKNAKNDKTPFIEIGKSTALFAQRRDNFSPTEPNLKLGLSIKDLSTHLFTLGASGTGKTYGIIRPIAKKWVDLDQGGMIVIDGKGVLPLEIQAYCDSDKYQLITPSQNKFNPLLGMSADSFADTLSSVCSSSNESDPFWSDSARLLLRMAGNALNTLHTPLSFNQIYSFIMLSVEEKERLFSSIYSEKPLVKNMMSYFLDELPNMPDKTRDGIINMVRTWLGNIINNKDLSDWVETDSNDVMIEDVFLGKKIGLLVPETQYGKGGAIISAIIMRKIYDTAKKRGDAWVKDPMQTPVLMVADEIQNILSTADIENVAIARSLGLYLLMASQNIDGLYKRLGKDGTVQMLGNFASIVALPPKTNDSNDYLALRSGSVWKAVVTGYHGIPDSQADFNLFGNKSDETLQSFDLYRRVNIKRPRLVYSLGLLNGKSTIQTLPSLSFDVQPLVSSSEIDNLLSKPYTAIAILNRGGVARRDVIDLGA